MAPELRRLLAGLTLIAALLTACVVPPPAPTPEPPPPPKVEVEAPAPVPVEPEPAPFPDREPVSDFDRLLHYYAYVLALPAEQLGREYERTQRFYGQNRTDFTLLQLVMLKSLPNAKEKDNVQALEMVNSYLKDTRERESELRPLGLLLKNFLAEHQRQEAEIAAQTQKFKDETRKNEELKQKLDALVEMERMMLERNKPVRPQ